jgi:hypothetical protein
VAIKEAIAAGTPPEEIWIAVKHFRQVADDSCRNNRLAATKGSSVALSSFGNDGHSS